MKKAFIVEQILLHKKEEEEEEETYIVKTNDSKGNQCFNTKTFLKND